MPKDPCQGLAEQGQLPLSAMTWYAVNLLDILPPVPASVIPDSVHLSLMLAPVVKVRTASLLASPAPLLLRS